MPLNTPEELASTEERYFSLLRRKARAERFLEEIESSLGWLEDHLEDLAKPLAEKLLHLYELSSKMAPFATVVSIHRTQELLQSEEKRKDIWFEFEGETICAGFKEWVDRYEQEFVECFRFPTKLLFDLEQQAQLDQAIADIIAQRQKAREAADAAAKLAEEAYKIEQAEAERKLYQELRAKYGDE